jgi:hypothetical protein
MSGGRESIRGETVLGRVIRRGHAPKPHAETVTQPAQGPRGTKVHRTPTGDAQPSVVLEGQQALGGQRRCNPPIRIARTARGVVGGELICLCCSLETPNVQRGRHD